jgi:hypothetical protein
MINKEKVMLLVHLGKDHQTIKEGDPTKKKLSNHISSSWIGLL